MIRQKDITRIFNRLAGIHGVADCSCAALPAKTDQGAEHHRDCARTADIGKLWSMAVATAWDTGKATRALPKGKTKLVGDPRQTFLYDKSLTIEQAQDACHYAFCLARSIAADEGVFISRHAAKWGCRVEAKPRQTKTRYGTAKVKAQTYVVRLYPLGMNWGTFLHEIAHVAGVGHDRGFKAVLSILWAHYEERFTL